jgi:hypothetical protein
VGGDAQSADGQRLESDAFGTTHDAELE